MNRPTFSETVSVLVKAYLNDTLVQGHPCGCGCGNIIAAANGLKVINADTKDTWAEWDSDVIGSGFDWFKVLHPGRVMAGDADRGFIQIESTGYSREEFYFIEEAFENVDEGIYGTPGSIFAGLMAVVDALASIHNVDLSVKESAKLQFVKI